MKVIINFVILAILIFNINIYVDGSSNYKPIILMHGFQLDRLLGGPQDWDLYISLINRYNPGQLAFAIDLNNGLASTKPMYLQASDLYKEINRIINSNKDAFKNGYHLLGHSQGALLLRSVLEIYGLNATNYISLSSVHGGVYGFKFSRNYFFSGLSNQLTTTLFYTPLFQYTLSCANWWRDLNDYRYLNSNVFLPHLNQEYEVKNSTYKSNFINSIGGTFYVLGSKDDGTVIPWTSQFFGFYDSNNNPSYMNQSNAYINDTYGLKTLDNNGKLKLIHVDNVTHDDWILREDIFHDYVLQLISN